jgi:NAD+ kinase
MKSKFQQVALFGKYQASPTGGQNASSRQALLEIALFLQAQGCKVVLEAQTAANTGLTGFATLDVAAIGAQCDLGLVVGGDGTMLGIGRQLASAKVPLIGVNHGRLGFMTDIPFDSYAATLTPMLQGAYEEDLRELIHARVMRKGQCVFDALAMNDVVVHRGATAGMVELRVEVNGHFVANQRADGLIIATPTGSTAYSLSAGGPILHPSIAGWLLAPIAPHTLSNRPVVFSSDSEIALEIASDREASANFDMQTLASLQHGDRIIVNRSEHQVKFLHPRGWTYFDTLRQKLHWNEGGTLT